jgi:DNA-binding IclR family transcriptional regulator
MSELTRALGRAHAVDVLRALGASTEGQPFNTIRRLTGTDSRTMSALLREFDRLGLSTQERGLYHLTPTGGRVLAALSRLHSEAGFPW